jgi:ribosomal-protein-alanine N-acetyltransferase
MRYETERLVLRSLSRRDAPALLDYLTRNRDFLSEWEPVRDEAYYTLPSAQEFIRAEHADHRRQSAMKLHLSKKGEKRIIGYVGLSNIVRGAFLSCFAGCRLDADEINRGYMTEAMREVIRIAFDGMGLHRIEANIIPRNVRSRRVVEKLGFTLEGMSRKYLRINGVWEDHLHYVVLNEKI